MKQILNFLIYFFLFALPWQTRLILRPGILGGGNWEYGIIGIYATEILLWLIILVFLILNIKDFRKIELSEKICGLGFLVLFLISLGVAEDKWIVVQQFVHLIEAAAVVLIIIKVPLNKFKAIVALLAGLMLSSALAVYQFLIQTTFVSRWLGLTLHNPGVVGTAVLENFTGRWLRSYGTFQHPNILGAWLAIGILLVVWSFDWFGRKARIFFLFAIGLMSSALFFSFSRAAILMLLVVLAVYLFSFRNQIKQKIALPIFILLILLVHSLVFWPLLSTRLAGVGQLESWSTTERINGYRDAWELFKKNPVLGVGLGNYTLAIYERVDFQRLPQNYQPVHNAIILSLIELGAAGFGLFFYLIFKVMNYELRIMNKGEKKNFLFSIIHASLFIVFFILALFDHYLWSLYPGLMLMAVSCGLFFKQDYGQPT